MIANGWLVIAAACFLGNEPLIAEMLVSEHIIEFFAQKKCKFSGFVRGGAGFIHPCSHEVRKKSGYFDFPTHQNMSMKKNMKTKCLTFAQTF